MKEFKQIEIKEIITEMEEFCAFDLGRKELEDTQITYDTLLIKQNNARIKEALKATYAYGSMPFYGISDINKSLEKADKDMILNTHELLKISDHQSCLKGIINYQKSIEFETPCLSELIDSLVDIDSLSKDITKCINDYGEILDSASSTLKGLRNSLKQVEGEISTLTNKYVSENSSYLVDNIITTRNDRVVVLAKTKSKNTLGGIIHGESASGMATYVEPPAFMNLNNKKQSVLYEIVEEENRILFELSQKVKSHSNDLRNNTYTLSILDSIFAKAEWGKNHDCCVAELNTSKDISLIKAFHPLINAKDVVKNNYILKDPNKIILISGPNTGGKTVSLKTISLAVIMTYMGMPICAEEGSVPFFDDIYIDIGDNQSVETSLSTFSAHLAKIAEITNNASSSSFVVLDELGSGTDPKEGEALAISVLEYLQNLGCTAIISTHYGALKAYGKNHNDILLASVEFDNEKLKPTYRFIEGLVGQSNALEIASFYGLKEDIINKAKQIKKENTTIEEELIEKLEKQYAQNIKSQDELEKQLEENRQLYEDLLAKQKEANRIKENQMDIAKEEAAKYLEDVKNEANSIIKELSHRKDDLKLHEAVEIKKKLDDIDEDKDDVVDNTPIKLNDYVRLKSSNQIGYIESINGDKIVVNINGVKVKSSIDKVTYTDVKPPKKVEQRKVTNLTTSSNAQFECNIIGMHVDEALDEVARFLDQARFNHLPSVRIITGDGTGALRKAVHEYLKKQKFVEEFHLGSISEGSTGATIAKLKG